MSTTGVRLLDGSGDASVIIMDMSDAGAIIKSSSVLTLHPFVTLFLHTIGLPVTCGIRWC